MWDPKTKTLSKLFIAPQTFPLATLAPGPLCQQYLLGQSIIGWLFMVSSCLSVFDIKASFSLSHPSLPLSPSVASSLGHSHSVQGQHILMQSDKPC